MLGVTLFGLLLTPVFFYSIDWLGESNVFRSPAMHFANRLSLDVLTLKPFRWTARAAWHQLAARRASRRRVDKATREIADVNSLPHPPQVNGTKPKLMTPSMRKHLEAADAAAGGIAHDE